MINQNISFDGSASNKNVEVNSERAANPTVPVSPSSMRQAGIAERERAKGFIGSSDITGIINIMTILLNI